jgi:hypothetical protein
MLIQNSAKQHGVTLIINHARDEASHFFWTKLPVDITGKQNPKISHFFCSLYGCKQIWHGKFYPCTYIAYADDFNKAFNLNLEITGRDYLDINSITAYVEIEAFLKGPFPFCRYCKTTKTRVVPWRRNVEKRLEDWV